MLERVRETNKSLKSIAQKVKNLNSKLGEVKEREGTESEEIQQVENIREKIEARVRDAEENSLNKEILQHERQSLEKAVENIRLVSSELDSLTQELPELIETLKEAIKQNEEIYERAEAGEIEFERYSEASYLASNINMSVETVQKLERELTRAEKEREKALDEAEKLLEIIPDLKELKVLDSSFLKNLENKLRSSAEKLEEDGRKIQKSEQDLEKESETGRRGFMEAAGSASVLVLIGMAGCASNNPARTSGSVQTSARSEQTGGTPEETSNTGDSESPTSTPKSQNPWRKNVLRVALINRLETEIDIKPLLEKAMSYWEKNGKKYLGYQIAFREAEKEQADIRVSVERNIDSCGAEQREDTVGCSPIGPNSSGKANIKVEPLESRKRMLTTLKHELGHALGLRHGDPPQAVMADEAPQNLLTEKEEDILVDYREALRSYNSATSSYNNNGKFIKQKKFDKAIEEFQKAKNGFTGSARAFSSAGKTALQLSREVNNDKSAQNLRKVAEEAEKAEKDSELLAESSEAIIDSINAKKNNNRGKASEKFNEYKEKLEEAKKIKFASDGDIESMLRNNLV